MVTYIGGCMLLEILSHFPIFKCKGLTDDLKEGSSVGGGFAMSDSEWSNSILFHEDLIKAYLEIYAITGGLQ